MTGRHGPDVPDDPPPCEGCPWVDVCREGYACQRFVAWLKSGTDDMRRPRVPTRWRYAALFPEDYMAVREALVRPAESSLTGSSADYGASVVLLGNLTAVSYDGAVDWAETGIPA